ncbi:hypothetical protein [Paractinoplanes toevensis]|uniref:Uncharacterized protein n=1 Tax=Paractinoplanes toevensis TaxID=571911 RepID=A0A919T4S1_9ACTN|nr:hypothetical protein [Actinoplanes toevensis]GIM88858.1 hypothetical protein Ato02nite_006510 [Actinoplanes toevensis]
MSGSTWVKVAHSKYDDYRRILDEPASKHVDLQASIRERQLAEMVPHLAAEIERLQAIVTAVTALTRDTDGNDLNGDVDLPVGVFQQAIHEGAAQ